jgi:hypothetical protein
MKNILVLFTILSLSMVKSLAQGVSNTKEPNSESGIPKYQVRPYSISKYDQLSLIAKKLTLEPFKSFQKNIGVYKGADKNTLVDSISWTSNLENIQEHLVVNAMPIVRPNKHLYMPVVNPLDSLTRHHILIKKLDVILLDTN